MNYQETPLVFLCGNCRLVGIAAKPETPSAIGVLIVVGGPQYRAGSHRQFTLLARDLAASGFPSLRFDYRGMGDSEGEARSFAAVDEDLAAAVDALQTATGVARVVIWGLCDAASAAMIYAHTDARVCGLALLNPWAHTVAGAERARLKYYYVARLFNRSFWSKLMAGQVSLLAALVELARSIVRSVSREPPSAAVPSTVERAGGPENFLAWMLAGMARFTGKTLLVLSGNDLVAREFQALIDGNKAWQAACQGPRFERRVIADADHTFSTRVWREQASVLTKEWLKSLET